jgi:anti-sigma regulatory factor (Ser/Thr protein kinase)
MDNADPLLVSSKEIGLEVNAKKTNYMVMSRDQTARQSHNIKVDNSYFEKVEELKRLGTILTNQNSIWDKIKIRLNSGNTCYHSVQNVLCSSLLSKFKNEDIQNYTVTGCAWV